MLGTETSCGPLQYEMRAGLVVQRTPSAIRFVRLRPTNASHPPRSGFSFARLKDPKFEDINWLGQERPLAWFVPLSSIVIESSRYVTRLVRYDVDTARSPRLASATYKRGGNMGSNTVANALIAGSSVLLGYFAPIDMAMSPAADATSAIAESAPGDSEGCQGAEPRTTLEVEPIRSRTGVLDFGVKMRSRDQALSAGAYAWAIWRDRGDVPVLTSAPVAAQVDEEGKLPSFSTPNNLEDGFYMIQVEAAAASSDGFADEAGARAYLEIVKGEPIVLSQAEWRARSAYMTTKAQ